MTSTVLNLIYQNPTNPVQEPGYTSTSNKNWTRDYPPIKNLIVHTQVLEDGSIKPNYDNAFFPMSHDDTIRLAMPANAPSPRYYRLEMEADAEAWFHAEISNIVLSAWSQYPVVMQTSHTQPLSEHTMQEAVDMTYAYRSPSYTEPLVVGEMKRNLIDHGMWQSGRLRSTGSQAKLSQELRGYADKYNCPQIFCFDGATLLLLQFCATDQEQLKHPECKVDCMVFPRECGTPLREALYRFLLQGYRRFQGNSLTRGFKCARRQWYNGRPLWLRGRDYTDQHPDGYQRSVDAASGALIWTHPETAEVKEYESVSMW